jgi:hypothetical protein
MCDRFSRRITGPGVGIDDAMVYIEKMVSVVLLRY